MHAAPRVASAWLFDARSRATRWAHAVTIAAPVAPRVLGSEAPQTPAGLAQRLLRQRPIAQSEHLSLALGEAGGREALLLMTVPKKVLSRAVDRNQFRRIARESWRAVPDSLLGAHALVRLRRRPSEFARWPSGERARRWRSELDALLSAALSKTRHLAASAGRSGLARAR